jgi:Brp/Blh family beta-carotene 15,15'-monooxygenase
MGLSFNQMPKTKFNIFSIITWLNVLVGLLLFLWQRQAGNIPYSVQLGFFLILVGATGIPHGALDHIIAKNNREDVSAFNIQQFLRKYLLAIIAYSICWIYFPSISLLIFLLISAWHFGETDLVATSGNSFWDSFGRMICGIFILTIILLTHKEETLSVVQRITKGQEQTLLIWSFFAEHKWTTIISTGTLLSIFLTTSILRKDQSFQLISSLNLIIILFLCSQLPLLVSFALYFGGWHAIRSFEITFSFLKNQQEESASDPLTMWKNALPMTFLAAFGFIFMAYIWTGLGIKTDPIPALFIFLSIITLPHLDVMDKLIRSQKHT